MPDCDCNIASGLRGGRTGARRRRAYVRAAGACSRSRPREQEERPTPRSTPTTLDMRAAVRVSAVRPSTALRRSFSQSAAASAPSASSQPSAPEHDGRPAWEVKSAAYLARPLPSLRELRATPLTETPSKAVLDNLAPSFTTEPGQFFTERVNFVGGRARPGLSTFYMRDPYFQETMIRTGNLLDEMQRKLETRGILRPRELPPPPEEKYRMTNHWVNVDLASARLAGATPGNEDAIGKKYVTLRRFQFVALLDRLKEIARYLPYIAPGGVLSGLPPPFGQEAHPSIVGQEAASDREIELAKQLCAELDKFAAPTSAMGQARKARFNISLNAPSDPDVQVVRNQPNPGAILQARAPEERFAKMWTMDVSGRIHASGARKLAKAAVWIVPARTKDAPGESGLAVEELKPTTEEEGKAVLKAHEGAADQANDSFNPLPPEHMLRTIPQGVGTILVNGEQLGRYFTNYKDTARVQRAFTVLGLSGAFNVYALVSGGGNTGQAGAIGHALAKALVGAAQVGWITAKGAQPHGVKTSADQQAKSQAELAAKILAVLRKDGVLRRDPRMPERKKTGKPGARASHTWVKR